MVTAVTAIAHSLNIATINLAQMVGFDNVAALARDAGVTSARATPAMAIGAYSSTPLEMAGAYTVFANGGVKILRRGYNFVDGADGSGHLDAGLFFVGFMRDPHKQFVPLQRALAKSDRMMEYIEHTGSASFAVPPEQFAVTWNVPETAVFLLAMKLPNAREFDAGVHVTAAEADRIPIGLIASNTKPRTRSPHLPQDNPVILCLLVGAANRGFSGMARADLLCEFEMDRFAQSAYARTPTSQRGNSWSIKRGNRPSSLRRSGLRPRIAGEGALL